MLQTYKTRLSQKTQLTADVFLFRFKLFEPLEINFTAGQYLILMVPQDSGEPARRLYSILSPQTQKNSVDLLVKLLPGGIASEYLRSLNVEERVEFQGPAGMFTFHNSTRDKIFLATGTGIAPMRSMVSSMIYDLRSKIYLFWGLPKKNDLYFFEELKQLATDNARFHFLICFSREESLDAVSAEERKYFVLGHVTEGLEKNIENWKLKTGDFDYYLCGGRSAVESLREYLVQKQIPANQIYFEKF